MLKWAVAKEDVKHITTTTECPRQFISTPLPVADSITESVKKGNQNGNGARNQTQSKSHILVCDNFDQEQCAESHTPFDGSTANNDKYKFNKNTSKSASKCEECGVGKGRRGYASMEGNESTRVCGKAGEINGLKVGLVPERIKNDTKTEIGIESPLASIISPPAAFACRKIPQPSSSCTEWTRDQKRVGLKESRNGKGKNGTRKVASSVGSKSSGTFSSSLSKASCDPILNTSGYYNHDLTTDPQFLESPILPPVISQCAKKVSLKRSEIHQLEKIRKETKKLNRFLQKYYHDCLPQLPEEEDVRCSPEDKPVNIALLREHFAEEETRTFSRSNTAPLPCPSSTTNRNNRKHLSSSMYYTDPILSSLPMSLHSSDLAKQSKKQQRRAMSRQKSCTNLLKNDAVMSEFLRHPGRPSFLTSSNSSCSCCTCSTHSSSEIPCTHGTHKIYATANPIAKATITTKKQTTGKSSGPINHNIQTKSSQVYTDERKDSESHQQKIRRARQESRKNVNDFEIKNPTRVERQRREKVVPSETLGSGALTKKDGYNHNNNNKSGSNNTDSSTRPQNGEEAAGDNAELMKTFASSKEKVAFKSRCIPESCKQSITFKKLDKDNDSRVESVAGEVTIYENLLPSSRSSPAGKLKGCLGNNTKAGGRLPREEPWAAPSPSRNVFEKPTASAEQRRDYKPFFLSNGIRTESPSSSCSSWSSFDSAFSKESPRDKKRIAGCPKGYCDDDSDQEENDTRQWLQQQSINLDRFYLDSTVVGTTPRKSRGETCYENVNNFYDTPEHVESSKGRKNEEEIRTGPSEEDDFGEYATLMSCNSSSGTSSLGYSDYSVVVVSEDVVVGVKGLIVRPEEHYYDIPEKDYHLSHIYEEVAPQNEYQALYFEENCRSRENGKKIGPKSLACSSSKNGRRRKILERFV